MIWCPQTGDWLLASDVNSYFYSSISSITHRWLSQILSDLAFSLDFNFVKSSFSLLSVIIYPFPLSEHIVMLAYYIAL